MTTPVDLDWLNKYRLRLEFLPRNPFFQEALDRTRKSLDIPPNGFALDLTLGKWLVGHAGTRIARWAYYPDTPDYNVQPARIALIDAELWFKESQMRLGIRREVEELQVWKEATKLLVEFDLPQSVQPRLVHYVLTDEPIPPELETVLVESYDFHEIVSTDDIDDVIDQEFGSLMVEGLPREMPGKIVVVRMLVNDYTTKKELVDKVWGEVKKIKNDSFPNRPNRRREITATREDYRRWLPAYLSHRIEGKSLDCVANDEGIEDVETLRYRIEQLDELFVRPKK